MPRTLAVNRVRHGRQVVDVADSALLGKDTSPGQRQALAAYHREVEGVASALHGQVRSIDGDRGDMDDIFAEICSRVDGQPVPPRVVLYGPPSSGKGEVSKAITERYGLTCVTSADMIRWGSAGSCFRESGHRICHKICYGVHWMVVQCDNPTGPLGRAAIQAAATGHGTDAMIALGQRAKAVIASKQDTPDDLAAEIAVGPGACGLDMQRRLDPRSGMLCCRSLMGGGH